MPDQDIIESRTIPALCHIQLAQRSPVREPRSPICSSHKVTKADFGNMDLLYISRVGGKRHALDARAHGSRPGSIREVSALGRALSRSRSPQFVELGRPNPIYPDSGVMKNCISSICVRGVTVQPYAVVETAQVCIFHVLLLTV